MLHGPVCLTRLTTFAPRIMHFCRKQEMDLRHQAYEVGKNQEYQHLEDQHCTQPNAF